LANKNYKSTSFSASNFTELNKIKTVLAQMVNNFSIESLLLVKDKADSVQPTVEDSVAEKEVEKETKTDGSPSNCLAAKVRRCRTAFTFQQLACFSCSFYLIKLQLFRILWSAGSSRAAI
jgi:hypothetical protein